jgi:hypothetical protein
MSVNQATGDGVDREFSIDQIPLSKLKNEAASRAACLEPLVGRCRLFLGTRGITSPRTESPTLTPVVTPSPTSSTTPAASIPGTWGGATPLLLIGQHSASTHGVGRIHGRRAISNPHLSEASVGFREIVNLQSLRATIFHKPNCAHFLSPLADLISHNRHATVDCQAMADDVTCPRTAQPQYNRSNLLRSPSPPNGNALCSFGIHLLVSFENLVVDLGVNQAGFTAFTRMPF